MRACVLRGGVPVFVDIRRDTLNLDEKLIEEAITPRTRAIVPVHYAGVACEMDTIIQIAKKYGLRVVEDAAQGLFAYYKGKALGTIGDLGTYSFHETKNVISGEGGALLINASELNSRAEIIREKGTDRSQFFRGAIDKYTWQDVGSSFLPGELIAAFLWAQLEESEEITARRIALWQNYHYLLEDMEKNGILRRPIIPEGCAHNAHIYYVILKDEVQQRKVSDIFKREKIGVIPHYVPLHSSPAGNRYGRVSAHLEITENYSRRLLRLPMWLGLSNEQQSHIVNLLYTACHIL